MQFTSFSFFLFLIITLIAYFLSSYKLKNAVLLAASYFFYLTFDHRYFLILISATSITYFSAIISKRSKNWLIAGILGNISLLFFFKYYLFFRDIIKNLFSLPFIDILLPIGISFYVFQNISYLADIFSDKAKPEKDLLIFALSVSFFPKIISGPIERSSYIRQFKAINKFNPERFSSGLEQMLFGFFKKIVIADRLAIVVNIVYGSPDQYHGTALLIAAFFYMFQLYADFSGYTDIAIGVARLFGIELTQNFKRPYLAKNLSDFWRRWHISLSTFIRDYIYIPLGGSRSGMLRTSINVVISFALCGLWHGANYTFVFFGLYFGILIAAYNLVKKIYEKLPLLVQISCTFVLVFISWIFFRAESITQAIYILKSMFVLDLDTRGVALGVTWAGLIINFILIAGLMFFEILQEFFALDMDKLKDYSRWTVYLILLLMIVLFGAFNQVSFVYSQF